MGMARDTGLSTAAIMPEVTESALVEVFGRVARVLHELTGAGFTLSLVDFGTGHSSSSRHMDLYDPGRSQFRVVKSVSAGPKTSHSS